MTKALILKNDPNCCRSCELCRWDMKYGYECGVTGNRIYNPSATLCDCPLVDLGDAELAQAMVKISQWLASGGE